MHILIVEILLALFAFLIYRVLMKLESSSTHVVIAGWLQSLWVPLLSLLFFTWFYFSFNVLPWDLYIKDISSFFDLGSSKETAAAIADYTKYFYYYAHIFFVVTYSVLICWVSNGVIKKWEVDFYRNSSVYSSDFQSSVEVLFMILRALVYLIIAFVLMRAFDLDHLADSLFTTGAVGALFVSFAARDSIANIFGGFMILLDRPFRVGDYISSPDRDIEGTVERIGWRVTQVRTPQKRTKYIPNCLFSTVSIENLTRMSNRRIRITLGIRYLDLDKVAKICKKMEKSFEKYDFIDKRMSNFCTFNSLGDFSVNILLNVFTRPQTFKEYNKSIEIMLHTAVKIIKSNDADFPFPTTTLDANGIVSRLKELQDDKLSKA
ncbi:MAG: mechanosensitive ion channel family protein [Pseudomonadota bacterium]|nr:mechanosensitive ion channel family protein [Pseudomonadota bacterium]